MLLILTQRSNDRGSNDRDDPVAGRSMRSRSFGNVDFPFGLVTLDPQRVHSIENNDVWECVPGLALVWVAGMAPFARR